MNRLVSWGPALFAVVAVAYAGLSMLIFLGLVVRALAQALGGLL